MAKEAESLAKSFSNDDLPSRVTTTDQMEGLPNECRSGQSNQPLRHVDENGEEFNYSLQPMKAVWLILVVEAMERFAYYGIYYTLTLYLTGVYNEEWNAGLTAVEASSYVSTSTAVAYSSPFLGAWLSDYVLGDYWTIVVGSVFLYIPGLVLVAMTSVPNFLGQNFNKGALAASLFFLWPTGSGFVKSVVNVFGAKQFHPLLQRDLIESYYVSFYTSINIGALIGITLLPIIAQFNVSVSYGLPVLTLSSAVVVFIAGTNTFVIRKPIFGRQWPRRESSSDEISLTVIFRISLLIVPFAMAYSQMPTTLIVQGTVMKKALGFIDAATLNFVDALTVIVFGSWTATYLFPALSRRGIQVRTTHKFALGSLLAMFAIIWALFVDCMIRRAFVSTGEPISVLWQTPSFVLIGCGEIFAISAAYEVAFKASSPRTKALASAVNIFCVGGIPNVLCVSLYHSCRHWFYNSEGRASISHLGDYVSASVYKYFGLLVGIVFLGVVTNMLPSVSNYVDGVEKKASSLLLTPRIRRTAGETTPLLAKEFLRGRMLYRMSSMRAGNIDVSSDKPRRTAKMSFVSRLYKKKTEESSANIESY